MLQAPTQSGTATTKVDVDADLVDALRRGDAAGVEQLVERHGPRVYRLALRILRVREDAEEAAQDALWQAARNVHTFEGASAFSSWLYRIAVNAAYQRLRVRRRRSSEIALDEVLPRLDVDGHLAPMEDWSKNVDDPAQQAELREVLTSAADALSPDYHIVVALHDVEGLSSVEIAAALGISVPAVKSRLHRSRLFLRQRLAAYFGGLGR
jgi:RNA polymerase sigma-70 factor (ECF subfamily)